MVAPFSHPAVSSIKLEHGCGMIYAGFPSFFGLRWEAGHVQTFWPLLHSSYSIFLKYILKMTVQQVRLAYILQQIAGTKPGAEGFPCEPKSPGLHPAGAASAFLCPLSGPGDDRPRTRKQLRLGCC